MKNVDTFHRGGSRQLLHIEDVPLPTIAEQFGTPVYVYSKRAITRAYDEYCDGLTGLNSRICVSVKANGNLSLLSLLAERGAGFDVVSGGELSRVVAAGGDSKRVVFAGVGKSDTEIVDALRQGILMFNVESAQELQRINELARDLRLKAPVALRVNPDVDPKTHPYISTGLLEHKFGIPLDAASKIYREYRQYESLEFVGIDCHIGSLIGELAVFREAFEKVKCFADQFRPEIPTLRWIDLGGGLGVPYHRGAEEETFPSIAEYTGLIKEIFGGSDYSIVVEPGRSIFANSAVLLTRVLYVKHSSQCDFVVVDAGFSDFIRPVLYQAFHEVEPVSQMQGQAQVTVDLVGPICESADCFAHRRLLPELKRGELVVLHSAGAYGFSMASNYNTRPRPAEVLIDGSRASVIRPRESVQELLRAELECLNPRQS